MRFFEKFREPTKKTLQNGVAIGAATGVLASGGNVLAQQQNPTEKDLIQNNTNESIKKQYQPTITEQAKKMGITINPENLESYNATTPYEQEMSVAKQHRQKVKQEGGAINSETIRKKQEKELEQSDVKKIADTLILEKQRNEKPQTKRSWTSPSPYTEEETTPNLKEKYDPKIAIETIPNDLPIAPERIEKNVEKAIKLLKDTIEKMPSIFKGKNLITLIAITASALAHNVDANATNLDKISEQLSSKNSYNQKINQEIAHESIIRQTWLDYVRYPETHHFQKITPEEFLNLPESKDKYHDITVKELKNIIAEMSNAKRLSLKGRLKKSNGHTNMDINDIGINSLKNTIKNPTGKLMNSSSTLKAVPQTKIHPLNYKAQLSSGISNPNDIDPRSNVYIDKNSGVSPSQVTADPESSVNIEGVQIE